MTIMALTRGIWSNDYFAMDESNKKHKERGGRMKAHKYWSLGALLTMFGTFYTGYKGLKSEHKYFATGLKNGGFLFPPSYNIIIAVLTLPSLPLIQENL